jgi:fatty-acyl-CoA synthase
MESTMQDFPLTITMLLRHGMAVHARSEVVTWAQDGPRKATFGAIAERAARLAEALTALGVAAGDRVATFQWNNQEHLESYLAVPSMGAVLHTLNIRLFPEQVVYIANHAEDKIVVVDDSLVPLLARVLPEMKTVEHVLVTGPSASFEATAQALSGTPAKVHRYEALLAAGTGSFEWADDLDERSAAAMCYTSGTTGHPKGVVYSHRSAYLHSMAVMTGSAFGLTDHDRVLPVVPMFHANAWGLPYAAWLAGADMILPDRFLQAEPLACMIETERPTVSGAVPTVWNDLLRYAEEHGTDLSSLRVVPCGGSAVPGSLMRAFQDRHRVTVLQAWGMTETSPVAAIARPPKDAGPDDEWHWREMTGRVFPGVQCRIVDVDGTVLPSDGVAVGEYEVRGPWVTGAYYKGDDPNRFHDGWLRTGDVGTIDDRGFMKISDRAKDVIKSGGEWISSVDLENALMGHPDVVEAAVVAVPDDRWQERPLAAVVVRPGASVDASELRDFLGGSFARWQLPERWTFVEAVPKTSVGKFDKKVIRQQYGDGRLDVFTLDVHSPSTTAESA